MLKVSRAALPRLTSLALLAALAARAPADGAPVQEQASQAANEHSKGDPPRVESRRKLGEVQRSDAEQAGQGSERGANGAERGAQGKGRDDDESPAGKIRQPREQMRAFLEHVRVHRERVAKLNRLARIFEEKGDAEKLTKVQGLLTKENERYAERVAHLKQAIGPERFAELMARIEKKKEASHEKSEKRAEKESGLEDRGGKDEGHGKAQRGDEKDGDEDHEQNGRGA
jgi:hypothetical protein